MIFMSAGSDIAIKTCFELFTKKNDKVIIMNPTFGMVNVYCNIYALKSVKIGFNKKLELDYKKLFENINKRTSLIILAQSKQPYWHNNSKGNYDKNFSKTNKLNIPLVIDEAYEGFFKKLCKIHSKIQKYNNYSNFFKVFWFGRVEGRLCSH